jgi:DNA-binding NtrC family response regulator
MMITRVLVADDEPLLRRSLAAALAQEGFEVAGAASGAETLLRFREVEADVVLLDLRLGDADGIDVMRKLREQSPQVMIIVMTAHGSIENAVAAMKLGAYDFIRKPFELEEMIATVRNASRTGALERRVEYWEARQQTQHEAPVAVSPSMRRVVDEAVLIAANPVPVTLVAGESGTGKQLIARLLHERSDRARGPFIELNCSAIPDNLIESELFGHERGAFSDAKDRKLGLVEVADGGTLFLDEVGDLAGPAQAKLLTFIEQRSFRRIGATSARTVDVRIVAATNRDLVAMVNGRSFREDLYYRLSAMTLRIPPLRERPEDVPVLAERFLGEAAQKFRRRWSALAPETGALLARYRWPGNVRELRAVLTRAALLQDGDTLLPSHLPADLVASALGAPEVPSPAAVNAGAAIPTLAEVELEHIRRVLELCQGNRTVAAQRLGITRQTLAKKLDEAKKDGVG